MSHEKGPDLNSQAIEDDLAEESYWDQLRELKVEIDSAKTIFAEQVREETVDRLAPELIEALLSATGSSYKVRSVSGAYVSLCLLHAERTPSLFMYPSNKCVCYGCSYESDVQGLIVDQKVVPLVGFFEQIGISVDEGTCREIDYLRAQEHELRARFRF